MDEELEHKSNPPDGQDSTEEEKPEKAPPEPVRVCEVLSGKLGMIKRIEWPGELGEMMAHGKRIIFEDSYGTDWAIVLRPGDLFEEVKAEEPDDMDDTGARDFHPRGRYREAPQEEEDDDLNEEDRTQVAISKLDGRAVRYCDDEDMANIEHLTELEGEAMEICVDRIKSHNLPMKLLASDYRYDRSKVTFHFSAENRVDFRQLVRDLASIFKCRIELHQIGIRDEARLYPGLGPCGELQCCQRHLTCFRSVSIRMARLQNLPLNPSKISGNCGRLMCCLNYEYTTYSELSDMLPKVGAEREIDGKRCTVVFISPLIEQITMQVNDETGKKFTVNREEYEQGRTKKTAYPKKDD